jgi:hypothetical protein
MKGAFIVVLPVLFGAAIVAAPGKESQDRQDRQDRTAAPGQPTQGRVWIQNRGVAEAVPVGIKEIDPEASLRVQISGTPVVHARPAPNLQWEYQTITVAPDADPVAPLNKAGLQGWEITGLQLPGASGTLVVLKRPR